MCEDSLPRPELRAVAIVPAAGKSRRMGQAKLLLPWGNTTVIEQVIAAWRQSSVREVFVVVSPDDKALAEICRASRATVVVPPVPPPDMKASLKAAIGHIQPNSGELTEPDCFLPHCFLVAPADMPWLRAETIDRLLESITESPGVPADIVVPTHEGRRGHPIIVPWRLAEELLSLAEPETLKSIVDRNEVWLVECDESVLGDLDTPEEYKQARLRWNG
jgi:molybdenum cofactor cytidylyltransferase